MTILCGSESNCVAGSRSNLDGATGNLAGDPLIPPPTFISPVLTGLSFVRSEMTQYKVPVMTTVRQQEPIEFKMKRRTRLYLMDGTYVDTPLNMAQLEFFIQSAGRSNSATPFLRTVGIDKSGKMRSTLISYGFLARVEDLESYA